MDNDTTIDGTPASLEGQTIGVVKDTASAKVLKSVVPGATLKSFTTPKEALDAFYAGDVSILGGGTLWMAANSRIDKTAPSPPAKPMPAASAPRSRRRCCWSGSKRGLP